MSRSRAGSGLVGFAGVWAAAGAASAASAIKPATVAPVPRTPGLPFDLGRLGASAAVVNRRSAHPAAERPIEGDAVGRVGKAGRQQVLLGAVEGPLGGEQGQVVVHAAVVAGPRKAL